MPEYVGLRRALGKSLSAESTLRHMAFTALTDARFYPLHRGTEATCFEPMGENLHGIDEDVTLALVHEVTRMLAVVVAEWCGVEKL